jgi:hypothetical protein
VQVTANRKEGGKLKRPCATVYFEDEAQLERAREASGGNLSEYCRERILYNDGYADERQRVATRLLRLVSGLWGDLHQISDLVRATHALRTTVRDSKHHGADRRLLAVVERLDDTIEHLLEGSERSSGALTQLTREIHNYALACADHELAQKRAATIQQRHKVKP